MTKFLIRVATVTAMVMCGRALIDTGHPAAAILLVAVTGYVAGLCASHQVADSKEREIGS